MGELTSDLSPQRAAPDLELSHRAICSRGCDRLEDASVSSDPGAGAVFFVTLASNRKHSYRVLRALGLTPDTDTGT